MATVASLISVAALVLPFTLLAACTNSAPRTDAPAHLPAVVASSLPTPIATNLPDASVSPDASDASAPIDASAENDASDASDGSTVDASEPVSARPFVADNKVLPDLESDGLTLRARKLFDAIVQDDPALGESFWFPKEPFIPLKDVKGPDKYWNNLHSSYERDIHALHKKRKSWEGASFVGFKVGSTPKWVPPGDEANKIGYYRSFRGKLTYRVGDNNSTLDVHTIISWQGEWFITHLNKFKKK